MRTLICLLISTTCAPGCFSLNPVRQVTQPLVNLTKRLSSAQLGESDYRLRCPDIVEISIASRPDCSGTYAISAEGRLPIRNLGEPRVEGQTTEEVRQNLAELMHIPDEQIRCRVVEHRSQMVYFFGPAVGPPRPIPFQGSETVTHLLQRIGGLNKQFRWDAVEVLRGNVADGNPPQVFRVDLNAILNQSDPRSDVTLHPFDEIHLLESKRSQFWKMMPDWLKKLLPG
jgi:polysaccharide biosynthesis/export protein